MGNSLSRTCNNILAPDASNLLEQYMEIYFTSQDNVWARQALHDRLPTTLNLQKRNLLLDATYTYYESETETLAHILYSCTFIQDTRHFLNTKGKFSPNLSIMHHWMNLIIDKGTRALWVEILICWIIWQAKIKGFLAQPN